MPYTSSGSEYAHPYDSTAGVPNAFAYVFVFFGIVIIIFLVFILRKARKNK